MSNLIAIVGDTGTGKSTAIQYLNPKETYIISVAAKELPFKGSAKIYNKELKNYREEEDAREILKGLQAISKDRPDIKNVIIDDGNYVMAFNLMDKAMENGYAKFALMAKDMTHLIQGAKKLRDDLTIFYLSHSDEVEDAGEIVRYKLKTSGKMLDSQIKMEGLFTVVLYSVVEERGDKTEYFFTTNKYKKYPSKSPVGMFAELKIPNNLQIVADSIRSYYS